MGQCGVGVVSRCRKASSLRSPDGFTLIEIMMALGVLGFGLLGLAVMQLHALAQSSAGRHTGDASAVARTHLEQVHRLPWSVLDSAVGSWLPPAWIGSSSSVETQVAMPGGGSAVEETYSVDWRVTEVGAVGCLREVEVRVRWNEPNLSSAKVSTLATRRYNWGAAGC